MYMKLVRVWWHTTLNTTGDETRFTNAGKWFGGASLACLLGSKAEELTLSK
jgi:hypothetical protein